MATTKALKPHPMQDSRSKWRFRSRAAIRAVFAAHPELVSDGSKHAELKKLVSQAYPFGERRHWPYKKWCDVVREEFRALAAKDARNAHLPALHRRCGACGAKPGLPCRGIAPGDPVYEHEMVIRDAEMDGKSEEVLDALRAQMYLHESRTPPPPTLPLFEGIGV